MMESNEKMHLKAQNEENVSEKKSDNTVGKLNEKPGDEAAEKRVDEKKAEAEKKAEGQNGSEKSVVEPELKGEEQAGEPVAEQKEETPAETAPAEKTEEKPVVEKQEADGSSAESEKPEEPATEPKKVKDERAENTTEQEKDAEATNKKEKGKPEKSDAEKAEKPDEIIEKADKEKPIGKTALKDSGKEAENSAEEKKDNKTENKDKTPTDNAESENDKKSNEKADKETAKKAEPEVDYSTYTEVELINAFRDLLKEDDFLAALPKIDTIKAVFYKKLKAKNKEQKKKFLDEGGMEEEFKPEPDPYEQDMKDLMQQVRQKKAEYNKDLEAEKEENLKLKYEIIEEIKNLVNRKESINKTFQEFRELQQRWRDTGLVPQASMKDLWENYHHHVENFYDYIKINKELRDLDLKKNLEEKIILCEKAEALLLEPSVLKAFNTLQKYHDLWREIGPVPRDKKEELWERFKAATTLINKKHQEYFENRKKNQKKNLEAKTAICEKVEEILQMELKSHKEWEARSKELIELQKYWRTIGFAPKKDNKSIYERFRTACDRFFDNKREFYARHKEMQANNLHLKIDLCVQAEALKDSTDWKKTTDEFISIQKKWKEIGPVPRKHSDAVWKRFRAACDYFFKQKSAFFNTKDETQVENLKLKNELIEEIKNFKSSGNDKKDFESIRNFQRRWNEIGFVPIGDKNDVQRRFREAINEQFDKLQVDDKDRNLLKFKNKVVDWKGSSKGQNKMMAEREKSITKLKHLENDLITLKNNVGFFADSKNAEALIKDVKHKIARTEEQIEYLKDKIRTIDSVDMNGEAK
jgi:hypothetical protein